MRVIWARGEWKLAHAVRSNRRATVAWTAAEVQAATELQWNVNGAQTPQTRLINATTEYNPLKEHSVKEELL